MMLRKIILGALLLGLAAPLLAQGDAPGTTEATINGKKVVIIYGRPSLRGRDLLSLAPVGTIWRLGRNQATRIESAGELVVAGKTLPAGKYSLWAKKTGDKSWTLLFHPNADVWGAPALKEGFVAEMPLKFENVSDSAEQLTIKLTDQGGKAHIGIHWGTLMLSGDFGVK
ncbi:MAG TPA: DUF2911 domain-containing protein [Blastocatellia bacterium]|nr:DUF2911 domain-containing protein [Blastocatellia bacterium]